MSMKTLLLDCLILLFSLIMFSQTLFHLNVLEKVINGSDGAKISKSKFNL